MADKKISAMTALTGTDAVGTDVIPILDLSEADATKNKKITIDELKKQGTVDSDLPGLAWDGSFKTKTLTANTALTFSSTQRAGILRVQQDATGSRTLSINGTAITINTAANSVTYITAKYVDTISEYDYIVDLNVYSIAGGGGGITELDEPTSFNLAAASDTQIDATWGDISNESSYTVQLYSDAGYTALVSSASKAAGSTSHSFTGLTAGTTYYGRIKSVGDGVTYSDSTYVTDSVATTGGGGGYDTDAATYFTAVATAGVTLSTPEKDAYNTWVLAEKAASRYTKYTAIYPMMGGTAATHAINAKTPGTYNLAMNGTITHDANGMRTAGTTSDYAEAVLKPSDFGQDSIHIGIYVNDDNDSIGYDMGAFSANGVAVGRIDPDIYTSGNTGSQAQAATDVLGMNIVTRVLSTEFHFVKAGTVFTKSVASGAPTSANFTIGLIGGLYATPSTRRYGFATVGSGLTTTEAQGLNTTTTTLQTSLSRA